MYYILCGTEISSACLFIDSEQIMSGHSAYLKKVNP